MSQSINLTPKLAQYILESNTDEHPALEKCRRETVEAFPDVAWIQISPEQGAFMQLLVRMVRARRVLELGTFTGYSALALALALTGSSEDGAVVVTIDKSEEYLARAAGYWSAAGVSHLISPRLGEASKILDSLQAQSDLRDFDLAFIDADKEPTVAYYEKVLPLLRPGGLIIVDNVLWGGEVVDRQAVDPQTQALREVVSHAKHDSRVIHNVCAIGDGLLLAIKK
ncbi:MAG TPA: class I SAM-dependent methyltransferase [Allosphingosinicella sp.]|jgi:caffeoyl-CoA O-methyltransferase